MEYLIFSLPAIITSTGIGMMVYASVSYTYKKGSILGFILCGNIHKLKEYSDDQIKIFQRGSFLYIGGAAFSILFLILYFGNKFSTQDSCLKILESLKSIY